MESLGCLRRFDAQLRTELDFEAAAGRAVVESAPGNRRREHLLEADRLRAELDLVVSPAPALATLVLDRERGLPVGRRVELDHVGIADES